MIIHFRHFISVTYTSILVRMIIFILVLSNMSVVQAGEKSLQTQVAKGEILEQYVLLAFSDVTQNTVPLARVIVQGADSSCPSIVLGGSMLSMQPRPNPDASAFDVQVCEALLKPGVNAVIAGQSRPLPTPASMPMTIHSLAVFGDSGCKDDDKQPCDDPVAWPFPVIVADAVKAAPDVVLHMGDYNYRGTPSKTADDQWAYDGCLSAGSEPTVTQRGKDTWTSWQKDFFTPAQPLLETTPWIVTRGNHELCSRAGQGWFYFLDPHSTLLSPYTELPGCHAPTMQTKPYQLSMANVDFVVLDSTNACGGEAPETNDAVAFETFSFQQQFNTVYALRKESANPGWLLTHRPLWGISLFDGESEPELITDTLQNGLKKSFNGVLPESIQMVLSGHMHEFQATTFDGARQPQLVVGHSGVRLSDDLLAPEFKSQTIDGMQAHGVVNTTQHGYLLVNMQDGGHWTGQVYGLADNNNKKETIAECAMPIQDALCYVPSKKTKKN